MNQTIHMNHKPVWDETFDCDIRPKSSGVITFSVYDKDHLTKDDLVGVTSLSVRGISNKPTKVKLPIINRKDYTGKLTLIVSSRENPIGSGYGSGPSGESLHDAVHQTSEISKELQAQVAHFSAENERYKQLNQKLEGNIQELQNEITALTSQVDRFTQQNDRLESEVNHLHQENVKLEETSKVSDFN